MLRILILADDLSGAADCGVACVRSGLKTVVSLEEAAGELDAEVLSIDADTRGMTPDAAAREVDRLVRSFSYNSKMLLYKKIDSTLRGNVSRELAAALCTRRNLQGDAGGTVAVMAPAFPASGRTTVNGIQLVHGKPLHDLDIWRLQGMTGSSYIPDILDCAGLRTALLQLDLIRSADRTLADAMKSLAQESDVLVCDAETDADLLAIATASMELGRDTIWVGSAGLAYHLPHAAGLDKPAGAKAVPLPPLSGPLLFVIGSLSRNSIEQMQVLISSSQTLHLSVPTEILLAGEESARWEKYARDLERAIAFNRDVVLGPDSEPHVEFSQRSLLTAALARMTNSISGKVGGLIASGGETARAVLQSWGVKGLRLVGELERGIPVSLTENWSRQVPVVTKAGDFGSSEALLRCLKLLRNSDRTLHQSCDKEKVTL